MSNDPTQWEVMEDDQGWSPSLPPSPGQPAEPVSASAPVVNEDAPLFSHDEIAKAKAATRAAAQATAKGAAIAATVGAKWATHAAKKSGQGLTKLKAREWKRPTWLRLPPVRNPRRVACMGLTLCAVLALAGAGLGGFHIYKRHQGSVPRALSDPGTFTPDLSVGVSVEPTAEALPAIDLPAVSPVPLAPFSAPAFVISSAPVSRVPVVRPEIAPVVLPVSPAPVAKKPAPHVAATPAPVRHASPKPTPSKPRVTAQPSQAQQVDAWFHQLNH